LYYQPYELDLVEAQLGAQVSYEPLEVLCKAHRLCASLNSRLESSKEEEEDLVVEQLGAEVGYEPLDVFDISPHFSYKCISCGTQIN